MADPANVSGAVDLSPDASPAPDDFARLKGWVKDSLDKHSDWYKEAKECFGFVAGRSIKGDGQWPGESWQQMLDTGRQPIEFNRVGPIVDAICGMEVNNRQEVKYLPRTQGDTTVNERLTSLGDWARDETQAEDEESEMFRNAVICGRGFTETRLDFDEEPTGKIVVEHIDPLECGVDPASRRANFINKRYIWRYRDLDTDEAAAMFKGVDGKPLISSALDANWANEIDLTDGGEGNKRDYPDETRASLKDGKPPKTVRIVQIQWWERESMMLVAAPDSPEPQTITVAEWDEMADAAEGLGYTAQPIELRRYRQAFLGRSTILEQADIEGFTINATTGRLDRNKGYHYGVVRPMRDPSMLANKTLSQVLHILNTNAKGGLIIEKGVFANPRDAEKDWSDPSKTIVVNAGGAEKIKDRTAPPLPQALVSLQEFSISSIRDVTGVSVEMLGLADRDQAASLEYQRRQSAMTILASLFDSLRRYRKSQGRTMLDQLRKMPPGALVRVLVDEKQVMAEYEARKVEWDQIAQQAKQAGQQPPPEPQKPGDEFLKQPRGEMYDPAAFGLDKDARFDVIVDEAPSSPNQKEGAWAALQPFMASLPPTAVPIALKYSPLPESAAKELGDAIAEAAKGPEIPPELQQQIEQGQARIGELETENAGLKSSQQIDQAKVQIAAQDSDTKRMTAEANAQPQLDLSELTQAVAQLAAGQRAMMQIMGMGQ